MNGVGSKVTLLCPCLYLKRLIISQLKSLRKEARSREDKVVQEVLKSRDVVLATCVGAATHSLRDEEFDLVVIDEAAQVRGEGRGGEGISFCCFLGRVVVPFRTNRSRRITYLCPVMPCSVFGLSLDIHHFVCVRMTAEFHQLGGRYWYKERG